MNLALSLVIDEEKSSSQWQYSNVLLQLTFLRGFASVAEIYNSWISFTKTQINGFDYIYF